MAESEIIAIAKAGVCKFTEVALHGELLEDDIIFAVKGEAAHFRANNATGTFTGTGGNTVDHLNDGSTDYAIAEAIDEYAEVVFDQATVLKRWRHRGTTYVNGDGVFKIQYWNIATDQWVDWVTGIAIRVPATWSNFVTETTIFTTKIRLICTTVDTGGTKGEIDELEIIY